jgi:hypothetical protein
MREAKEKIRAQLAFLEAAGSENFPEWSLGDCW